MDIRKAISALPRGVRVAATVLVVGLSFLYLGNNIARGLHQVDLAELRPQPIPVVFSLLLYTISSVIGGWCWSLILDGLGQKLPWRMNVKIHLSANIVKYLPGYTWQILGKAYLCGRQGLSIWPVGVGIALEFACVILTGLWVAILALPGAWLEAWGMGTLSPWRVPGVAILTAVLIALPWLLQHGLHRLAAGRVHARSIVIHRQPLWLVLVLMLVAWFVLGLSFYTLASAVCALSLVDLPALTFAWAASSILSLAVVFVPMGIGVKEGALAFLLGFRVPIVVATVIAVLARVISVVSEALCFLLAQKL